MRWLCLLLLAGAWMSPAVAAQRTGLLLPTHLLAVAESTRLKLMACLARGDIAGALAMYEAHTGRVAPAWLQELQVAYSVASQKVGSCQQVARTIHTAFSRLGQQPQYVAFRAQNEHPYMTFDLANGKSTAVTQNSYHVAVRLGDIVYDAYTGAPGMKMVDYLSRLQSPTGVVWEVVSAP